MEPVVLIAQRPCVPCHELGVVPSEAWDDYRRWAQPHGITEDLALFDGAREYFVDVRGFDAVPEQSHACRECGGSGVQQVPLPLEDLADHLLSHLQRPALDREQLDAVTRPMKDELFQSSAAIESAKTPDAKRQHARTVQELATAIYLAERLGPAAVER